MSLGENIRRKRQELKLSQEYVADQLGVSHQAVSKWETGQSEPTAGNLVELAAVFEISLSELVDPQKYAEEQSAHEKEVREKDQAAKMWICRFAGYIVIWRGYRAFLQYRDAVFPTYWLIVMGIGLVLLWISSKDYFQRAKLTPLQAVLGAAFIASVFVLPRLLPETHGLNFLVSDALSIAILVFLDLKYWRRVWKRE